MSAQLAKKKKNNQLVVQSNKLVEAYYDADLSIVEHRIIKYAASKLKPGDDNLPEVVFEVQEFLEAANIKGNAYHKQIEKIADELTKKRIKIKSKEKIGWFPWFQSIVYNKGIITITFNTILKELLLKIEGGYTKYDFEVIAPLKSGYSIRLFELLKQYSRIGKRTIEVEELKKMLGISEKYVDSFGNFNRRVLSVAEKELNKKTKIDVSYHLKKRGKRVVAIEFDIKDNYKEKQLELFADTDFEIPPSGDVEDDDIKETEFENQVISLLKQIGVFLNKEIIREKEWEKYGLELLEEVVDEIKDTKGIKYYPNYITKILKTKVPEVAATTEKEAGPTEMDAVYSFIFKERKKIGNEPIPGWLVKDNALRFFTKELNYSLEDANFIWDKYGDKVIKDVRKK